MKAKIIENNSVVPIEQVTPNTWNPKQDFNQTAYGRKNFAQIKKSVSKHGQVGAITVREIAKEQYEIINGYHRWLIAKELGWEKIEIKNLGKMSEQEAQIMALATEAGHIPLDEPMTAKMVKDLVAFDPGAVEELPYAPDEIEEMESMLNFNFKDLETDLDGMEPGKVDTTKVDAGKGIDITIPKDRVTDWLRLKEMHGVESDKKMIVLLIEQALAYGLQTD